MGELLGIFLGFVGGGWGFLFGWFLFYRGLGVVLFFFFKVEISVKTDNLRSMSHIYSRLPVSEPIVEANLEILSVVSDLQWEVLFLNRKQIFFLPSISFYTTLVAQETTAVKQDTKNCDQH